jgi:hypothetical protein
VADVARRSLDKFTYAPIRPSRADEKAGTVDMRVRGLDKVAFASALQARPDEVAAISSGGDGAGRVGDVLGVILEATAPAAARATWGGSRLRRLVWRHNRTRRMGTKQRREAH